MRPFGSSMEAMSKPEAKDDDEGLLRCAMPREPNEAARSSKDEGDVDFCEAGSVELAKWEVRPWDVLGDLFVKSRAWSIMEL